LITRSWRPKLLVGVLAAAVSTAAVACSSFSGDETPGPDGGAADSGADGAAVPNDTGTSSDAVTEGKLAIACGITAVCNSPALPVCCNAYSGDGKDLGRCNADDRCGSSGAFRCDDNDDCLALGKGTTICCAQLRNPLEAGAGNDILQSFCSAVPCQGATSIEACSLGGFASQCHGGTTCKPFPFFPLNIALCQ
jgi:hypothetical protein